jgi:hypothetical protein
MKPNAKLKRRLGLAGAIGVLGSPEMDHAELTDWGVSPLFLKGKEPATVKYAVGPTRSFRSPTSNQERRSLNFCCDNLLLEVGY